MQKTEDIKNAQKQLNEILAKNEEVKSIEEQQAEYERRFKEQTGISVEEYIQERIKKSFKTQLNAISDYMKKYNMTLDEMVAEVKQKKSKLTKSSRDCLLMLKQEFIDKCV